MAEFSDFRSSRLSGVGGWKGYGAAGGGGGVEESWMDAGGGLPRIRVPAPGAFSRALPRFNSLPIYLRVSIYIYLRSVCFLIHVIWRFVVTIGSDVVIFTVPFINGAGIIFYFLLYLISALI